MRISIFLSLLLCSCAGGPPTAVNWDVTKATQRYRRLVDSLDSFGSGSREETAARAVADDTVNRCGEMYRRLRGYSERGRGLQRKVSATPPPGVHFPAFGTSEQAGLLAEFDALTDAMEAQLAAYQKSGCPEAKPEGG